jgi:Domain of unknown function (DUF4260)
MTPGPLLHLEGVAVFAVSVCAYQWNHGSWLQFALLFLVPDISMVGYIASARVGAITYNAIHTYVGALALAGYSFVAGHQTALMLSFIWIAHVGFDRMFGFGLKYPTRFKDTHLNPDRHSLGIGRPSFGKLWQDDSRAQSVRRRHSS